MKLLSHFDAFLVNRVNLRDSRIEQLDGRVAAVASFLSGGDDIIAQNYIDTIPQGSYAQRTIINPVGTADEFDADVLLSLDEVSGWDAEDYVQQLYTAFRNSTRYRGMVSRHTRCVKIDYANEFHIDVVPYLERHSQNFITNRTENRFELTNPEGFNAWLVEQNRTTSGRLVKVIRLLKYLRDYKNTFSVKSVILTILLGERVDSAILLGDADHYQDVPTALKNIVGALDDYLQANCLMPNIADPSCPTESFNHRWSQEEYSNFRNRIQLYREWIDEAYVEPDRDVSLADWRKLFGDTFGTFGTQVIKASAAHIGRAADTEQFLERDLRIPVQIDHRFSLRVRARLVKKSGFRSYDLSTKGNVVGKGRSIKFEVVECDVPPPYDIYWKVRNRGDESISANAIRGQVVRDDGSLTRTEPTAYRGSHYVECYVVKNGVCVASFYQPVIIK